MVKIIKTLREKNEPGTGALILLISGIAVKVSGMLFKIPLSSILGDEGMGYFSAAYTVYTLFYTVSALGLPQALSILVSGKEESVKGRSENERIYKTALVSMSILGIFLSLGMLIFSKQLAQMAGNVRASVCIFALSPIIATVCISGVRRGWFQGKGNMLPTALSQLIESLGKLIFGLAFAYYAIKKGYSLESVAAFAIIGIVLSEILSLFSLMFFKRGSNVKGGGIKVKKALGMIVSTTFPIMLASLVMSFSNLLDLSMVMRRLESYGMTLSEATAMFGNYSGLVVPIYTLPLSLITPLSYSLMPALSSALSSGDRKTAKSIVSGSIRSSLIIACPCAFGLFALSRPVLSLIFGTSRAGIAWLNLSVLSLTLPFNALSLITSSILQAKGKKGLPVISMAIGCIVKLMTGYYLIGKFGMIGTPVSTLCCYAVIGVINVVFLRYSGEKLSIIKSSVLPTVSSIICSAGGYLAFGLLSMRIADPLACILSIALSAIIYAALIVVLPVFDEDTLNTFPGGKYIRGLLLFVKPLKYSRKIKIRSDMTDNKRKIS